MNPSLKMLVLTLAVLGFATPATARREPLPIGEWDDIHAGKAACARPFLKIEPARIIQRLEGGEGRCTVTSIKQKNGTLSGHYSCDWDKTIPPELLEAGDADEGGFSIVVKSPTRILFNNGLYGLCPTSAGSAQ